MLVPVFAALVWAAPLSALTPAPDSPDLAAFLSAYARGDAAVVLPQLAPDVVLFGSDVAELFRGREEARRMMAGDQQLWQHSAHIGAPEHLATLRSGDLYTAFFDAPFSVGGSAAVTVRFAMVWQLQEGRWLLVRSSNTVPTHGQAVADLLRAH